MGNICLKIAFACTVDMCPSIWRQPMYQPECTQPLHSSLSRKIMTYSKRHICTHFQASMNSGKWTLSCQETSKLSKQCCRCSYRWPLNQGLWHSKVDKIVNNFHGQNQFHFHDQTHNFYDQYSDLCCQFFSMFIFLIWDLTNFLGQNSWSVSILSWGQDFFFQPHSKIYDQSPFHYKSKFYGFIPQAKFRQTCSIPMTKIHCQHSNGISDLFQSAFQSSNPICEYYYMWLYALMCHCSNNRKNVV